MNSRRELIQGLIELSKTTEEADNVLQKYMGYTETAQKLAFLQGMFNVVIASRCVGENSDEKTIQEDDYWAILATIVNSKRR